MDLWTTQARCPQGPQPQQQAQKLSPHQFEARNSRSPPQFGHTRSRTVIKTPTDSSEEAEKEGEEVAAQVNSSLRENHSERFSCAHVFTQPRSKTEVTRLEPHVRSTLKSRHRRGVSTCRKSANRRGDICIAWSTTSRSGPVVSASNWYGSGRTEREARAERFRAKACPGLDPGWVVRVTKTRQNNNPEFRF